MDRPQFCPASHHSRAIGPRRGYRYRRSPRTGTEGGQLLPRAGGLDISPDNAPAVQPILGTVPQVSHGQHGRPPRSSNRIGRSLGSREPISSWMAGPSPHPLESTRHSIPLPTWPVALIPVGKVHRSQAKGPTPRRGVGPSGRTVVVPWASTARTPDGRSGRPRRPPGRLRHACSPARPAPPPGSPPRPRPPRGSSRPARR